MRLLIVEDETGIRMALEKGFRKMGYAVDSAEDGEQALECYYNAEYDAVLLDLNLPKLDGIEVLKQMKQENSNLRVLILSARTDVEDKILGLDLGANDYIAKPFHFLEVEARIRALLRRSFTDNPTILKNSNLTIHMDTKRVCVGEQQIVLTAKEYGILEYLVLHEGCPVSSEELIEHVWNADVNELTGAVKVHINRLRKKLPNGTIKTSKGNGYYV